MIWLCQATYSQALEDSGNDVSSLGGLQLFLNLERVAQSLLPIVSFPLQVLVARCEFCCPSQIFVACCELVLPIASLSCLLLVSVASVNPFFFIANSGFFYHCFWTRSWTAVAQWIQAQVIQFFHEKSRWYLPLNQRWWWSYFLANSYCDGDVNDDDGEFHVSNDDDDDDNLKGGHSTSCSEEEVVCPTNENSNSQVIFSYVKSSLSYYEPLLMIRGSLILAQPMSQCHSPVTHNCWSSNNATESSSGNWCSSRNTRNTQTDLNNYLVTEPTHVPRRPRIV